MTQSMTRCWPFLLLALLAACSSAQRPGSPTHSGADDFPRRYSARRTNEPIKLDGRLDDRAWQSAAWSEPFADIEGHHRPPPRWPTRMKMLWDQEFLYIGARLDEPHVWATLTNHDEIVFHDNDFEIFIDPDGDERNYYEIETNAFGTIFDLLLVQTYRAGGPAVHSWNLPDLRCAVHVEGTINDPSDVDMAWFVEMALPWAGLKEHAGNASAPPKSGDVWRMNFSRVEWQHEIVENRYRRVPDTREDNWVWSPQSVIDMHRPEHWGFVTFIDGVDR
jgi:hypothetical protein